jgi:hypothetical protein
VLTQTDNEAQLAPLILLFRKMRLPYFSQSDLLGWFMSVMAQTPSSAHGFRENLHLSRHQSLQWPPNRTPARWRREEPEHEAAGGPDAAAAATIGEGVANVAAPPYAADNGIEVVRAVGEPDVAAAATIGEEKKLSTEIQGLAVGDPCPRRSILT